MRSRIRGTAAFAVSALLLVASIAACSDADDARIKQNPEAAEPLSDGGSGP